MHTSHLCCALHFCYGVCFLSIMAIFHALYGTVVLTSHLRCALHFCYCIYFMRFMVLLPIMLCNTILICFCLSKSAFLPTFVSSLITCFFLPCLFGRYAGGFFQHLSGVDKYHLLLLLLKKDAAKITIKNQLAYRTCVPLPVAY